MKYGSRSKIVVKVKVFFDKETDRQTGQKLDAHRIGDSGGIKIQNSSVADLSYLGKGSLYSLGQMLEEDSDSFIMALGKFIHI